MVRSFLHSFFYRDKWDKWDKWDWKGRRSSVEGRQDALFLTGQCRNQRFSVRRFPSLWNGINGKIGKFGKNGNYGIYGIKGLESGFLYLVNFVKFLNVARCSQ